MADSIIKIEDLNPVGENLKGTAQIPISQDKVDYRVSVGEIEQSVLGKVSDRYLEKGTKIPNENLTFGEVKEGDTNVVSGGEVWDNNLKININIQHQDYMNIGYVNNDAELITSNTNYSNTGLLKCDLGDLIKYDLKFRGKQQFLLFTYDSKMNLLDKKLSVNKGVAVDTIVTLSDYYVVEENVSYVMFLTMSSLNLNNDGFISKVEKIGNILDNRHESVDLSINDLTLGSISQATGLDVSDNRYYRTDYMPIDAINVVSLSIRSVGDTFTLYDKDKNFIKNLIKQNNGTLVKDISITETDAKYFRLLTMSENHASYVPYTFYLKYIYKKEEDKKDIIVNDDKYTLNIQSVPLVINNDVEYPSLKCIRYSYQDNYNRIPYSWIYMSNKVTNSEVFYESKGKCDAEMIELFTWDSSLSGGNSAKDYAMSALPDGSFLFVFRTEIYGDNNGVINDSVRRNPIIYPISNYNEPYVIDFGNDIKPSAWLASDGIVLDGDDVYFCEYTRRIVSKGYLWKISGDYNNPLNWERIQEYEVSRDNLDFKHFHVVDKDPYSGYIYYTTGDYQAEIYVTKDKGNTFSKVAGPSEEVCRLTSFVWLEDAVYWSTDAWDPTLHKAFKCGRDSNGVLDIDTLEIIYDFKDTFYGQATYHTSYFQDINCLIYLNRYDSDTTNYLQVFIYDIELKKMVEVDKIYGFANEKFGFRCSTFQGYQGNNELSLTVGFDLYTNNMNILNNKRHDIIKGLQNLKISLRKI